MDLFYGNKKVKRRETTGILRGVFEGWICFAETKRETTKNDWMPARRFCGVCGTLCFVEQNVKQLETTGPPLAG